MVRVSKKERTFTARGADEPLRANIARANIGQRICDVVIALVTLTLLSPLLLVAALVVKFTSRGPVFYVQERVGLQGGSFWMLKFRTMRVDAEQTTGPIWAVDKDPRCTPLGGLLRRLSIDELPQLINVLRGEMSIVGPRPERPYFVTQFSREYPEYPERHLVRPGLTGWAQIHGWRGNTSLAQRLRCDLQYVRRQSLSLDFYILAMTPYVVLTGGKVRAAFADDQAERIPAPQPSMRDAA
jgi:exopolysaccharide biosynthesis polyprenyl glycosylphosphotransferase